MAKQMKPTDVRLKTADELSTALLDLRRSSSTCVSSVRQARMKASPA